MLDFLFILWEVFKHLLSHFLLKLVHSLLIVNFCLCKFFSCNFTLFKFSSKRLFLRSKELSSILYFSLNLVFIFVILFLFSCFHFFSSIDFLLLSILLIIFNSFRQQFFLSFSLCFSLFPFFCSLRFCFLKLFLSLLFCWLYFILLIFPIQLSFLFFLI